MLENVDIFFIFQRVHCRDCFKVRRHKGKEVIHKDREISTENKGFSTQLCNIGVG